MDITELLERAVADVVPAERRPTDAVLRLAESRRLGSRIRKALAGLVGVAVIGGGAVVVATGSDDGDRETEPPRPLEYSVTVPDGWSVVESGQRLDCTTEIAPRTVYRDAAIQNLGYCMPQQAISVTGPSLLVGRIPADVAEQIRAVGTPIDAGGVPGYATAYDAPYSYAVWLPAGSHDDLAYAAIAPREPDADPAFDDLTGGSSAGFPAELLDVLGSVTAKGDLPRDVVLPEDVAAVDLRIEAANVGPEPGGRTTDPTAVARLLDELQPVPEGTSPCGAAVGARTMHLQDARSHRWVRVDVLEDRSGCRTVVSELGGRRQVAGDPVRVVTEADQPRVADVAADSERVTVPGLSVPVPAGWSVVRAAIVDPCTLAGPAVVVAEDLDPSCWAELYARPLHPFVWVRSDQAPGLRLSVDDRSVDPQGGDVRWTQQTRDAGGVAVQGYLGQVGNEGPAAFVVGLDEEGSAQLRAAVASGVAG